MASKQKPIDEIEKAINDIIDKNNNTVYEQIDITQQIDIKNQDIDNLDDDILTDIYGESQNSAKFKLNTKWHLWYHSLSNKTDWSINSYKNIYTIETIKDFWDLFNHFDMIGGIHCQQFFFMRDGINPTWEDPKNRKGGSWSIMLTKDKYRDLDEKSLQIFTKIAIYLIGETLTNEPLRNNGISVCLKNPVTSIIKIWNCDSKYNTNNLLKPELLKEFGNIIYKANIPED